MEHRPKRLRDPTSLPFVRRLVSAQLRRRSNSLLLHRSIRITRWCYALQQIRTQKTLESTKPLILRRVDKLVYNERALIPTICPNENAITEGQTMRKRVDKIGCTSRRRQRRGCWYGNLRDSQ